MATGIPARLSRKEGRSFGLTLGIAFGVLGTILWWRGKEPADLVVWSVAALFLGAGLIIPDRLGPVHRAWMGLAHAISKVTTPIFMGVVYYVVLMPIGVVMRLFGRNPLTAQRGGDSVWVSRASSVRSDLERQF